MNLPLEHKAPHAKTNWTTLGLAWGLVLIKYHEPQQVQLWTGKDGQQPVWSCKRMAETAGPAAEDWSCLEMSVHLEETVEEWLRRLKEEARGLQLELESILRCSPQPGTPAWNLELEDIFRTDAVWNRHLHDGVVEERFKAHLARLEEAIRGRSSVKLCEVPMLLPEESLELVVGFNRTAREYPRGRMIHGLFSEQAVMHSERLAIVTNHDSLTYGELDRKSDQLAAGLLAAGVMPGDIVAVTADQTPEMVISVLAILKAGAAYLPIDLRSPELHNRTLLEDSGVRLVLSRTPLPGVRHVDPYQASSYMEGHEALIRHASENSMDLAYIIYTSGSTGTPKGVKIRHRGVVNYVSWFNEQYGIDEPLRVLLSANLTFDASVEAIFCTLLSGGTLVPIPAELLLHRRAFRQFIERHQVQIVPMVPKLVDRLLSEGERLKSVRTVLAGGEALDEALKERIVQKGYRLDNHYGPTEATIVTLTSRMEEGKPVTIGKPIWNTSVYIVNSQLQPCPVGIVGEICISGVGLAAGYWKREELTAMKFVPNPFEADTLMYRTGDMGRWLSCGEIEYRGRADDQLKINGILIHPESIRHHLTAHPDIQEAAVLYSRSHIKQDEGNLVAFYRLKQYATLAVMELRAYLLQRLPPAMVPDRFVEVPEMPLNLSGKVDKKKLLEVYGEI